jgi:uncharacterized membrane protein
LDKQVSSTVLVLIGILLIFTVVQPLVQTNEDHFSVMGILGPNQTIGGYPNPILVGQSILIYGFVANHDGSTEFYQVLIKLGNQSTQISNTTSAIAPILASHMVILGNNQSSEFPMNLTITEQGSGQRLMFELWQYDFTQQEFIYTGLWNQIWINVTT